MSISSTSIKGRYVVLVLFVVVALATLFSETVVTGVLPWLKPNFGFLLQTAILIAILGWVVERLLAVQEAQLHMQRSIEKPITDNLDLPTSSITKIVADGNRDLHHSIESVQRIVRLHVDDREICDLIALRLVYQISQLLNSQLPRLRTTHISGDYKPSYAVDSILTRTAIRELLDCVVKQVEASQEWGIPIEGVTPDPKHSTLTQYVSFVERAVRQARYFVGVSLMPPSWWTSANDDVGLMRILHEQGARVARLKADGNWSDGSFSRIVLANKKFCKTLRDYQIVSVPDKTVRCSFLEAHPDLARALPDSLRTQYLNADGDAERKALQLRFFLNDDAVKKIVAAHQEAAVTLGFRLVDDSEYRDPERSMDFVLISDEKGFESCLTSLGFLHVIQQNNAANEDDLKRGLVDRLGGFMEVRLHYYQEQPRIPPTRMVAIANAHWQEHCKKLDWPLGSYERFKCYHNHRQSCVQV